MTTQRDQLFQALGHLNSALAELKKMDLPNGAARLQLHDTTSSLYKLKAEIIWDIGRQTSEA